jgi:hypothetical protein
VEKFPAPLGVTTTRCEDNLVVEWEIPEHTGHLLFGYEIMISGHLINDCKEHLEAMMQNGRCTIDWEELVYEPFSMSQGEDIGAKIRAKYENSHTSEWSEIGSGA